MITNIYSWIFPAAFFAAAGMYEITLALFSRIKQREGWSKRLIWFYIFISVSLGILTVSAFFTNWAMVGWSIHHLYFSIFFLLVFYFGLLFKSVIGLPLIILLFGIVIFFNLYFKDWNPIGRENPVLVFRVLSRDGSGVKMELQGPGSALQFSEADKQNVNLSFEVIQVDKIFFFSKESFYSRRIPVGEAPSDNNFLYRIVDWIESDTFLLSRSVLDISIGDQPLLYKYAVIIDSPEKISTVKFGEFFQ